MDGDQAQRWEDRAAYADEQAEKWTRAAMLLRALKDDPDAGDVAKLFGFGSDVRIYTSGGRPEAEGACAALGRAIRSIMAAGGPEISDPAGLLSLLTSGHRPNFRDVPWFKDGEPMPRSLLEYPPLAPAQ